MGQVLVTGAGGFVGWHMVKYLLDKGYKVVATDLKKPADPLYQQTKFVESDVTDQASLMRDEFCRAILFCSKVFHIAGLFSYGASTDKLFEVNVQGTRNLYEALHSVHNRPRVVVWGAGGVYGDFDQYQLPVKEKDLETGDRARTDNPYLLSKFYEERCAFDWGMEYQIPTTVIRPTAIYGPRSRYGLAVAILLMGRGKLLPSIIGDGKNHCGLVHVRDIAGMAEFLANHPDAAWKVFNATDDTLYKSTDITGHLAKSFGIPFFAFLKTPGWLVRYLGSLAARAAKRHSFPAPVDEELIHLTTVNSWLSNEKLKGLGYVFQYPDSLVGLTETIKWYRKEGWI